MSAKKLVWANGALVPHDEVGLSPFDLVVSVGLGVFETLISYNGVCPTFYMHDKRFRAAASALQMTLPSKDVLLGAVTAVIRANHLDDQRARVRMTLGAGQYPVTAKQAPEDVMDHLIITAVSQPEPSAFAQLHSVSMRCNEYAVFADLKSTSYAENVMAYRDALMAGADEAVLLNSAGNLCECSMSNIFLVKDGLVLTPSLSSGCLSGVTRSLVLSLCDENEILCEERDLKETELSTADEIFITSSAREIQPAKMLGSQTICPGETTMRISKLYQAYLEKEIQI